MLYLIDASIYIFRAWFSIPDDFVDTDGNPVNALYGYARFLGDFLEQVNPEYIAVAFDESLRSSFRSEIYPDYKANRDPAPPELKRQFELCRRYTRALGIKAHGSDRYEADDLIGTMVLDGRRNGMPSTIVSRDKDLTQLLSRDDIFWDFANRQKLGYNEIPDYFGVWPEQIADLLALAGDSVDNIPGVPGVGKKTAVKLLEHFGTFDVLYANLDRVGEVNVRGASKLGARLAEHRDIALLSRRLTEIACDAPVSAGKNDVNRDSVRLGAVNAYCDEANFGEPLRRQAARIADTLSE